MLVGCGNIGSRHLQALVKLPFETKIEVIEPNIDAQNIAKQRLNEIQYDKSSFSIVWNTTLIDSTNYDLIILATPSKNRFELIKTLVESGNKRFLVEKMVCQSQEEYELILSQINSVNSKAWVNASRRYFDSYQKIKNLFSHDSQINLCVNAGNMGLGSNAIHFLDLFLWITQDNHFSLNGDFLDNRILDNKRGIEYKEFSGTIIGKSSNNSIITINFSQNENPLYVCIFGQTKSLIIDETNETLFDLKANTKEKFKVEFQSTLTAKIVKDIFENDASLLPTLEESKNAHNELFRIFNNHIRKITGKEVEKCPIT